MNDDFWAQVFSGQLAPLASLRPVAAQPSVSVGSNALAAFAQQPGVRYGNVLAPQESGRGVDESSYGDTAPSRSFADMNQYEQIAALDSQQKWAARLASARDYGKVDSAGDVVDLLAPGGFLRKGGATLIGLGADPAQDTFDRNYQTISNQQSQRLAGGQYPVSILEGNGGITPASYSAPAQTNALADAYNASVFSGGPGDGGFEGDPFDGAFERGYGDPGYY